jgi:hypothetical protein
MDVVVELEAPFSLPTFAGLPVFDADSNSPLAFRLPSKLIIEPDAGGLRSDPFRTNAPDMLYKIQIVRR